MIRDTGRSPATDQVSHPIEGSRPVNNDVLEVGAAASAALDAVRVPSALKEVGAAAAAARDAAQVPRALKQASQYPEKVKGFPNYFNPSDPEEAKRIQAKVPHAMASILRRLQVPYIDPKTGKLKQEGFFQALEQHIKSQDPDAKVFISADAVHSLLGYVYRKIHAEQTKRVANRRLSPEQVLDRLIEGTPRRKQEKELPGESSSDDESQESAPDVQVPTLSVLGIGSDLHILIEFSKEFARKNEVLQGTTDFINSAENHFSRRDTEGSSLRKSLLPAADVKEYQTQIEGASSQGGTPLDWLAFPVNGVIIRMPESRQDILQKFFAGELQYVSPPPPKEGEQQAPASQKQSIRCLRALLELPFLTLDSEGEKQLSDELKFLKGTRFDLKALEEFEKMERNARLAGANNRFYNGENISQLVREISGRLSHLIREFTRNEPLATRIVQDRSIDKDLMSVEEFVKDYTNKGVLYHGTRKLENVLAIIRNGFIESNSSQGTALAGSGTYTTKERSVASDYTGGNGTVLELAVRNNPNLRVLDLKKFLETDDGKNALQEAQKAGQDLNTYLANKYSLDIIIRGYPIVMNLAAVRVPKNIRDVIKMRLDSIFRGGIPNISRSIGEFESLLNLAEPMGLNNSPSRSDVIDLAAEGLKNEKTVSDSITMLKAMKPEDSEIHTKIAELLGHQNPSVRIEALTLLENLKTQDPNIHKKIQDIQQNDTKWNVKMVASSVMRSLNIPSLEKED